MSVSQACNNLYNELAKYVISSRYSFSATVSVGTPYIGRININLPSGIDILAINIFCEKYHGWFSFNLNAGMTNSYIDIGIFNHYNSALTETFYMTIFYKKP